MSHSNIFEIRLGRRFSAEETVNGVMNAENIEERHSDILDYIPCEGFGAFRQRCTDRESYICNMLMTRIGRVFTRDGDMLALRQHDYDEYIDAWLSNIKAAAAGLTPEGFSLSSQCRRLQDLLPQLHWGSVYIYDEEEGDILDWRDWLLKASVYNDADGDGRVFYIGKVWNYHY